MSVDDCDLDCAAVRSCRLGASGALGGGGGEESEPLLHRGAGIEGGGYRGGQRRRARGNAAATAVCLVAVAVAVAVKGTWFAWPSGRTALVGVGGVAGSTRLSTMGGAHVTSLADEPDEAELRKQLGRGWVRRYDADTLTGSGPGGPGMPLAQSSAKTPEELKGNQFHKVFRQRQFRDFVVDARTGRPLRLTEEQERLYAKEKAADEAKEQAQMDGLDPFADQQIPSKYIYPDGEDVMPREPIHVHGMFDKHVGADGKIVYKKGSVFGVFREGAFDEHGGNENRTSFGKMGEEWGLYDKPLKIREVDYNRIREEREAAIKAAEEGYEGGMGAPEPSGNNTNTTERTLYCSGKECSEMWGKAGAGDQIVRLEDGKIIKGFEAVGPGGGMSVPSLDLDEHIDPSSGQAMPACLGPQCVHSKIDLGDLFQHLDIQGEPYNGTNILGEVLPPNPTIAPQDRLARVREYGPESAPFDDRERDPYELDPARRAKYERFLAEQQGGKGGKGGETWGKNWDAASWVGFVIIGPVLTAGVSVFIFMTRGPVLGLAVFCGLVVLDILLFWFG